MDHCAGGGQPRCQWGPPVGVIRWLARFQRDQPVKAWHRPRAGVEALRLGQRCSGLHQRKGAPAAGGGGVGGFELCYLAGRAALRCCDARRPAATPRNPRCVTRSGYNTGSGCTLLQWAATCLRPCRSLLRTRPATPSPSLAVSALARRGQSEVRVTTADSGPPRRARSTSYPW